MADAHGIPSASSTRKIFCPKCGLQSKEKANFCTSCGTSLASLQAGPSSAERNEVQSFKEFFEPAENVIKSEKISFESMKRKKSLDRMEKGNKGKKIKAVETVKINIGLVERHGERLKIKRGSYLPVEVRKTDSEITVKRLGVAKQQAHHRELRGFDNTEWKILYPDFDLVYYIPGTKIPFTVEKYKEALGRSYQRVNLYLCRTTDYDICTYGFDQELSDEYYESDEKKFEKDEVKEDKVKEIIIDDQLNDTLSTVPGFKTYEDLTSPGPSRAGMSHLTQLTSSVSSDIKELTDNPPKTSETTVTSAEMPEPVCPFDIKSIIDKAKDLHLSNPVEVLRHLQNNIVSGRPLELSSEEETIEGETNHITVDRDRIVETTFSELEFVTNYNLTFNVDFMGEESVDLGGPRKEWIRLMNHCINVKYFEHGLRPLLHKDYFYVGVMIAVAMLQNGQLPLFLSGEILDKIVSLSNSDPCIYQIQCGLEMSGILSALRELPMIVYMLRPGAQHILNVSKLLQVLKPKYSEEGSNALSYEKMAYHMFIRYVREVAASRRVHGTVTLTLSHILQFSTGAAEEPVLGFLLPPSIQFLTPPESVKTLEDGEISVIPSFLPSSHTCSNILNLPRPTKDHILPAMVSLFHLYDIAFSQPFFGKQ